MMRDYMFDKIFLRKLMEHKQREVFARISLLSLNELPVETIEGRITSGSINVDGDSAVRRSCQLSMVAQDVNINDFYWGLNSKFILEVGLTNTIDKTYPDIIWFKEGVFVLTSFSSSLSANSYTINLSGKDKMCLLNGDVGGNLPHTTDFGILEETGPDGVTEYISIPIKDIIREAVQHYGRELAQNIIINDLEDAGVRIMEYRGDADLYLLRNIKTLEVSNMTPYGDQKCYLLDNTETTLQDIENYDTLVDLDVEGIAPPTQVKLTTNIDASIFTIVKVSYGTICGYKLTDLTYAGDLIANVGETLTSVLDKIKNMLGQFEYFYDIDGHFVFQRKRYVVDTSWTVNEKTGAVNVTIDPNAETINLSNSQLITSFQNTPNLLNLRNDYSVWGKKTTVYGSELPIHMRYAIDRKPDKYVGWDGTKYVSQAYIPETDETQFMIFDWRELIYQMAIDYRKHYHEDNFLFQIAQNNPWFYSGKTGYEQYYVDMEGFWRDIYNPYVKDEETGEISLKPNSEDYWSPTVTDDPENLLFWFDFLEGDLDKYSTQGIGDRPKAVNDNEVKSIYYREIPKVLFVSPDDPQYEIQTGYTYIQIQPYMQNLFVTSSKGKSAKEAIDELLYKHSYCAESIQVSAIPIYYLEPNTKIMVRDDNSGINGEYVVSKITIPLTYNGTMSITATKAVSDLT